MGLRSRSLSILGCFGVVLALGAAPEALVP